MVKEEKKTNLKVEEDNVAKTREKETEIRKDEGRRSGRGGGREQVAERKGRKGKKMESEEGGDEDLKL